MTDAQIATWRQTLEGRYYEGQVTDLDINQLLEELVELRSRVMRLEGGGQVYANANIRNAQAYNIEREIIYGQADETVARNNARIVHHPNGMVTQEWR